MNKIMMILLVCMMAFLGSASALVVNVDFGAYNEREVNGYTGQGALSDPGNDFWTNKWWGWDQGNVSTNLIASDGVTPSGINFGFNVPTKSFSASVTAFPSIIGKMLADGRSIHDGSGTPPLVESFTFSGLTPDTRYRLYLYGGNFNSKGTLFTLNGVTGQTTGSMGTDDYVLGGNYVILDVRSDVNGEINGTFEPLSGQTQAPFNGFQITDDPFTGRGASHTPVPEDGDDQVDHTAVTSLSWYSWLQNAVGDPYTEPNLVSLDGYDVWFGTAGPDTQTFTMSQSLPVTLAPETTYYWRVDTHLTWDSNDFTGAGLTSIVEGPVWQFTTMTDYVAPEIFNFDNVITALPLVPGGLSATVTSSDPIISVTFEVLDGAPATVTRTDSDPVNKALTAELTTSTAGTYYVKLTVSDGTTPVEAIAAVHVYETTCEAKKNAPSGWTGNYYDTDDDCLVGVVDLADMADEWLVTTEAAVQTTEVGDVDYLALGLDIKVEAENAYAKTDPNYAAGWTPTVSDIQASAGQYVGAFGTGALLTYEVTVPVTGNYTVYVRLYHEWNRQLSFDLVTSVSLDGDPLNDTLTNLAVINIIQGPGADWHIYSAPVTLSAGTHLIRLSNSAMYDISPDFFGFKQL